jgi:hypothetical protein
VFYARKRAEAIVITERRGFCFGREDKRGKNDWFKLKLFRGEEMDKLF